MATIREGLGKVKGHEPETFVGVAFDIDRGVITKTAFFSEEELRTALKDIGRTEVEIDLIVDDARTREV
jgi:DNA helicase TIP49 (TBP-interacting protein)